EQGYNSDFRPVQFDESSSGTFNRSLLLSSVATVVDMNGIKYYEFILDVNQLNGQDRNLISLDELRLYTSTDPNLHNYNAGNFTLGGVAPSYDMDAGGDNWVKLDANFSAGSGKGDMFLLVPVTALGAVSPTDTTTYVTLYSK